MSWCEPAIFGAGLLLTRVMGENTAVKWVRMREHSGQMSAHVQATRVRFWRAWESIETSKRQNGGRFKFRGICFQLAGIRRKQNS